MVCHGWKPTSQATLVSLPPFRSALSITSPADQVPVVVSARILYLFAGAAGPSSLDSTCHDLAADISRLFPDSPRIDIQWECLDIKRSPDHDLLSPTLQLEILLRIERGDFFAIITTPP